MYLTNAERNQKMITDAKSVQILLLNAIADIVQIVGHDDWLMDTPEGVRIDVFGLFFEGRRYDLQCSEQTPQAWADFCAVAAKAFKPLRNELERVRMAQAEHYDYVERNIKAVLEAANN